MRHSVRESWNKAMKQLVKNKEIPEQLKGALKDYPALAQAFMFFTGYIGFLQNRIRLIEIDIPGGGFPGGELPGDEFPPVGPPDFPDVDDLICGFWGEGSLKCRCARGDMWACYDDLKEELEDDEGIVVVAIDQGPSCSDLKQQLMSELESICAIKDNYSGTANLSQNDFSRLRAKIREANDTMSQLLEIGCYDLVLEQIISVDERYVRAS